MALSPAFPPRPGTLTGAQETTSYKSADPVTTGTTPGRMVNGGMHRQSLSGRVKQLLRFQSVYGVPEKEILRGPTACQVLASAQGGARTIIVPVYRGSSPAKDCGLLPMVSIVQLKPETTGQGAGSGPQPGARQRHPASSLQRFVTRRAGAANGTNVADGDKAAAPGKGGTYEVCCG